jgi:hypothetical protein
MKKQQLVFKKTSEDIKREQQQNQARDFCIRIAIEVQL